MNLLRDPWQPLNPALIEASVLNAAPLRRVAEKLFRNAAGKLATCLNVLVLGGSVSCGHWAGDYPDAWPTRLVEKLNEQFPCSPGGTHTLWNECRGGVASDYWVGKLQEWKSGGGETKLYTDTDLVLVDTAINDVGDLILDDSGNKAWHEWEARGEARLATHVQSLTELILLLLRTFPRQPDILYTEMSWTSKFSYRNTTSDLQVAVARAHQVAYISSMAALRSELRDIQFREEYHIVNKRDCCHIRPASANLTANIFLRAIENLAKNSGDSVAPPSSYGAESAVFASKSDALFYLTHVPLVLPLAPCSAHPPVKVNANSSSPSPIYFTLLSCEGPWVWGRDNSHATYGLQASNASASLTFRVTSAGLAKFLKKGAVELTALFSYQHMGLMRLSVTAPLNNAIASYDVDCLWTNPISELSTVSLSLLDAAPVKQFLESQKRLNLSHAEASSTGSKLNGALPFLDVRIETIPIPDRPEGKVKITRLALW